MRANQLNREIPFLQHLRSIVSVRCSLFQVTGECLRQGGTFSQRHLYAASDTQSVSPPCLGWLVPPADLVTAWTGGLESFSSRGQLAARKLVMTNNIWRQPQLLKLPRNYDSIFQVLRPLSSVRPLS